MTEFVDAVAADAGLTPAAARAILAEHGVKAYTPRGRPAALRLTRLKFSGVKDPDDEPPNEAYEFEWRLQPGIQALASHGNSVGKTSVLGTIRWLLTGSDSMIDRRVRAGQRRAELHFALDEDAMSVVVDDAETGSGTLTTDAGSLPFTAATMADVIGDLMMDRLHLPVTGTFMRPSGSARGVTGEHGWPLYSGALFAAPTQLGAVIGSVPNEAGRVLQVYLALPWYETLQQARTARGAMTQAATDIKKAAEAEEAVRGEHTARIEREIAAAEAALDTLPTEATIAAKLAAAIDETADLNRELAVVERSIAAAALVADETGRVHREAERDAVAALEHRHASTYFRALQPVACPRCDEPIDAGRLAAEADQHSCSVCTRVHQPEVDERAILRAQEAASAAKEAANAARVRLDDLEQRARDLRASRDRAAVLVAARAQERETGERQQKLMQIARLRGRLDERADARDIALSSPTSDPAVVALDAAEKFAGRRVREQDELFKELNARILDLGQRFGIKELTDVRLGRNAHLPVTKGQTRYSFGSLAEGDRLRLKVAVVVALLTVGSVRHAGQHPGLLFVDSPGAQEVGAGPLAEMMTTLEAIADAQRLQIIIATARRDEAVTVLGPARVRQPARDGDGLW